MSILEIKIELFLIISQQAFNDEIILHNVQLVVGFIYVIAYGPVKQCAGCSRRNLSILYDMILGGGLL